MGMEQLEKMGKLLSGEESHREKKSRKKFLL